MGQPNQSYGDFSNRDTEKHQLGHSIVASDKFANESDDNIQQDNVVPDQKEPAFPYGHQDQYEIFN